jgi:DNA-binding NtrC family response regulator
MGRVRSRLLGAAGSHVPVLLTGETGTGKTLAARILHGGSPRRDRPFVAVNCAGIPAGLFESELFGHERGAFTGAVERRTGLFEAAHRGTLFLDEIGELAPEQQAKLLTVLDDGRVRRVGGERPREVDVRLVSATARDLPALMGDGDFRVDLFHRVAVVRIRVPALRERPEDVPELVDDFLVRLGERHGIRGVRVTPDGLRFLEARPWPGNLRELLHVLEAALVLSGGRDLDGPALEDAAMGTEEGWESGGAPPGPGLPERKVPGSAADGSGTGPGRYSFFGSEAAERSRIRAALEACRGNKTRAARLLGMSRATLRGRVRRYDLEPR